MRITHRCLDSHVFRLVATYEFDLKIDDDNHFPTRIELFRSTTDENLYLLDDPDSIVATAAAESLEEVRAAD